MQRCFLNCFLTSHLKFFLTSHLNSFQNTLRKSTRFTSGLRTGHTGFMNLYTLRLAAPLSWTPVATAPANADPGIANIVPDTITAGFVVPAQTQEGAEVVFIWPRDQLVADSDDGPRLCLPLPPPLQTGSSEGSSDASLSSSRIELPAGSYLFCQSRLNDLASIEQTLEWFFREAWWTRAECRGPVYLRLIREDGKTAVQVIMESAKEG